MYDGDMYYDEVFVEFKGSGEREDRGNTKMQMMVPRCRTKNIMVAEILSLVNSFKKTEGRQMMDATFLVEGNERGYYSTGGLPKDDDKVVNKEGRSLEVIWWLLLKPTMSLSKTLQPVYSRKCF
jgi:hypothetical protein